ncbi:DUF397 domain-containing protein [Nocardia sp. NPDC020380]|uniref:DUF397 domain-containing protein n=1 Tax=Nocardia sp. NPDC020380 TaxID=3364309 RepID=UPI0037997E3B
MTDAAPRDKWFKSSRSEQANACVEVKFTALAVGVRDSKYPGGPELSFTPEAWDTFLTSGIWRR